MFTEVDVVFDERISLNKTDQTRYVLPFPQTFPLSPTYTRIYPHPVFANLLKTTTQSCL
jgi:hypothetical protein